MKKYYEFELVNISKNEIFIVCKTYEDFLMFSKKIERLLKKMEFNGIIYVDQLSYTSNQYNRFFKIHFENDKFNWSKSGNIDGNKTFRKITSDFFHNNQDLLGNTLLSKHNKQRIINGEIV